MQKKDAEKNARNKTQEKDAKKRCEKDAKKHVKKRDRSKIDPIRSIFSFTFKF